MGYSTTFRLKSELDKRFISSFKIKHTDDIIQKKRIILTAICIDPFKWSKVDTIDYIYDLIYYRLGDYINSLTDNCKIDIFNTLKENNNEIDFYGWECSDSTETGWKTKNDVFNYYLEELFYIAIESTNTQFSDDSENYYKKVEIISNNIGEIEYSIKSAINNEFISFYREHPELSDESDGYNHKFPEENNDLKTE